MNNLLALVIINGVIIGSIYALISLGFNIIYNTTGVLNFAQGEFVMIGAISASWASAHFSLPIALLIGALTAGAVGVLVDVLAIRPARKASAVTHIIITIGASIIIRSAASLIWGTEPYQLPPLKEGSISIAGVGIDFQQLILIGVAAVCMLLLSLFFRYTTAGRAMKACASNSEAARLCGVSVGRMSAMAFGLSAFVGGIGGIMVTPMISMSYASGTSLGLKGFAAAILGGIGNPVGGVIGGLLLGVLEQYSCLHSSMYKDTIALAVVVVILLLRPRGLLKR